MKKVLARILAVFISAAMLLAMLAACAGSKDTDKTAATGKNGEMKTEEAKQAERVKISMVMPCPGPVDENSEAELAIEAAFPDIDLVPWAFERSAFDDLVNTRIAAGEIPDIIYSGSRMAVVKYVNQDLLAEVPIDFVKTNAPGLFQAILELGSDIFIVTTTNGKNYGLPTLNVTQTRANCVAWRKDWLDNVGITKVPETLEEFEEALVKFVNEDPDRNGQKDTYGLSERGKAGGHFVPIMGAFGILPGLHEYFMNDKGELQHAFTMPAAKEAFALLQRWSKMGLIDPEWVVTDGNLYNSKWANGKFGLIDSQYYNLMPGRQNYEELKTVNPNAEIVLGYAPKGPEGKFGTQKAGIYTSAFTFGKHMEEDIPKLEKAVRMLEGLMTDKELYGVVRYGREGVHYNRDPKTNAVIPIPPYNDMKQLGKLGTNFFNLLNAIPSVYDYWDSNDAADYYKYAEAGTIMPGKDYFQWVRYMFPSEVKSQYSGAQKVLDKWKIDFIVGEKSLDQFDQFVKEWMEAGGEALTKAANETYKNGYAEIEAIKNSIN